jgi:4-amino-4-deoxychorismate lyase
MSNTVEAFTTLRYDPELIHVPGKGLEHAGWNFNNISPFYMLDYHRDRLLETFRFWGWTPAIELLTGDKGLEILSQRAQEFIGPSQTAPLRFKVVVNRNGEMRFEKNVIPVTSLDSLFPTRLPPPGSSENPGDPPKIPTYQLVVDKSGTMRSEYTHFKTTRRDMYDGARQRAEIKGAETKEVLLVNEADESVMEGSLTTPYFWRNGAWVTPPVSREFSKEDGSGGQNGTSRRWALERYSPLELVSLLDS